MPEPDVGADTLFVVDCRGAPGAPYTGARALLRAVVPGSFADAPGPTLRHALTLLMVAPDLGGILPVSAMLARALALSREGNSRLFTRRLAHGVTEFLLEALVRPGRPRATVRFENVEEADPLDRELIDVLIARADPRTLTIAVGPRAPDLPAPAVPAPSIDLLVSSSARSIRQGFYESSFESARRGMRLIENEPGHPAFGELGRNIAFSLLMLGRHEEAEAYCRGIEAVTDEPALRSHCAYAMAILHARLHPPGRRDYGAARTWIERAIALAEQVPGSETKVVNLVFLRNTLALVEMRTGGNEEALRLLSEGLRRLESEAPSKFPTECIILWHNRARIHLAMGRPERALEDYGTLLQLEPTNSEAHLDRGVLLQRLGRVPEALADFDAAVAWSPPYAEAYFGRALALRALGRPGGALADLAHVLALEPAHAAARVDRAGLLYERGEHAAAREDVERVLAADPGNAKAWCLAGLLETADRRWPEARRAFDRALACDGGEHTALVNRATLLVREGDVAGALRDLDAAIAVHADATAIANRERLLRSIPARSANMGG